MQRAILRDNLRYFDARMEYDSEVFNDNLQVLEPTANDIAEYCKYITLSCKMENEIPVIALAYVDRLLQKTGILINKFNWKRILLICLCVASKVWDDDSLENIHFPKVLADVTLNMITKLEQTFLHVFLNYDIVVKGSEYAKHYFIMRSLSEGLDLESDLPPGQVPKKKRRRDDWAQFPLKGPISAD
mmetsp:Transcript_33186/g.50855  ORF Transcript_33186/g.50855 Transcript_33186/m.50855 type:complete len:187 (-) Transcript_33186:138-698(-)